MHVHLLAEAEDNAFHDPDLLKPPADEDICLLSDTLDAMLVDDPVPDHQGLVTSETEPIMDRELLMCDTNPVRLTLDDSNGCLTSSSLRYVSTPSVSTRFCRYPLSLMEYRQSRRNSARSPLHKIIPIRRHWYSTQLR